MSNKIYSMAFILIGLLFCPALADIEQEKSNIISLINDGNYAEAQAQTQQLSTDYSTDPCLPGALYEIAERFRWSEKSNKDKYECAGSVYQQIIQGYPDSAYARKAALGVSRIKVLSFIIAQDFDGARAALDEMVSSFSNDPNLPYELYWIGKSYGYWERHIEEKGAYEQIIRNYPNNPYTEKARLGFAKADVQSLIMAKDYDGAKKAFDKLVADFKNHPDLHDATYWIAERYAWSGRFDDANGVYQQIIRDYPNNLSAVSRAKLGLAVSNTQHLITSEKYDIADEAINRLIAEFAGHPDLAKAIRNIGSSYYDTGNSYYTKARMANLEGDIEVGKVFYRKAIEVWERLISELPDSEAIPNTYYSSAVCYAQELGEYRKGIDYFQKVVENYPDFEFAQEAQQLIVEYQIKMKNSANEK